MARTDRERAEIWVLSVGAPGHEQPAALSPGSCLSMSITNIFLVTVGNGLTSDFEVILITARPQHE